jgi:hypothetical protein
MKRGINSSKLSVIIFSLFLEGVKKCGVIWKNLLLFINKFENFRKTPQKFTPLQYKKSIYLY